MFYQVLKEEGSSDLSVEATDIIGNSGLFSLDSSSLPSQGQAKLE